MTKLTKRGIAAAAIMGLAIVGCTFEAGRDGNMTAEPHNPLESRNWTRGDSDVGICRLTSGHHGIDVWLVPGKPAPTGTVKVTRRLEPGNRAVINIGYHHYESVGQKFTAADSAALIADLRTGAPAYASFNRQKVGFGNRFETTILATNFAAQYDLCVKELQRGKRAAR